jgi:hypothetical protein
MIAYDAQGPTSLLPLTRKGRKPPLRDSLHGEFLAPLQKRKMPGFPTHIVGPPTIRGKARRYKCVEKIIDRSSSGENGGSSARALLEEHSQEWLCHK